MPLCSIIIPVYNKWELTEDCLYSLARYTPLPLVEIILVDNGSSDSTAECAPALGQKLFGEQFSYIRRDTDTHFAAGCNHGARQASGDFLFFLNNDTLLTEHWLPPLFEPFRTMSNVGATGPILLYGEERWGLRVQHLGISYDPDILPHHLYHQYPHDHPLVKKQRAFQGLTGAALMVPKALFVEAGMFNEQYINGYEDVELTALLSANGYGLYSVPQSCFFHLEGQSEGRGAHEIENSALFLQRVREHMHADIHTLLYADGYNMRWGEFGRVEIVLPAEREYELVKRFKSDPTDACCEQLLWEEPAWASGYEFVIDIALQGENHALAMLYALLQTTFFCNTKTLQTLLSVGKQVKSPELMQKAVEMLRSESSEKEHARRVASYTQFSKRYHDSGEEELAGYFDDWLSRYKYA